MNHETSAVPAELAPQALGSAAPDPEMVWIAGGGFRMGSDRHYPEERPVHQASVDGFWIDRRPVTNEEFARFVEETGHVTFAELVPKPEDYPGALPEMLYAGSLVFVKPAGPVDRGQIGNWWQYMKDADWRHPQGPGSSIAGLERHPVVHVAYERCRGVRPMGGQGAADGSRVGVCGPRWSGRSDLRLGGAVHARGPRHGQHLAG